MGLELATTARLATRLQALLCCVGACVAQAAEVYDNVFISPQERHLSIRKPQDLKGLTVISFPGAAKRYPQWLAAVKADGHYFEQNNQTLQVLALDKGRYDVVLSDRNIFRYFTLQLVLEKGLQTQAHGAAKLRQTQPDGLPPDLSRPASLVCTAKGSRVRSGAMGRLEG